MNCESCKGTGQSANAGQPCFFCNGSGQMCDGCGEAMDGDDIDLGGGKCQTCVDAEKEDEKK